MIMEYIPGFDLNKVFQEKAEAIFDPDNYKKINNNS